MGSISLFLRDVAVAGGTLSQVFSSDGFSRQATILIWAAIFTVNMAIHHTAIVPLYNGVEDKSVDALEYAINAENEGGNAGWLEWDTRERDSTRVVWSDGYA
ncbi:hypothetical protein D9758_005911 [Tetrapyrgos nigripes]|uniref:Uncharacterized protein n=1 Tax=Tetrapyrgos nigripes TaxID=182062 RepID=A0A8H5G2U5_9AGAR|nr:hypothetical protein D9758_005911 [Tetrapyrgos nigripes]